MGAPDWVDVFFSIKNGDVPASYVSLPGRVLIFVRFLCQFYRTEPWLEEIW